MYFAGQTNCNCPQMKRGALRTWQICLNNIVLGSTVRWNIYLLQNSKTNYFLQFFIIKSAHRATYVPIMTLAPNILHGHKLLYHHKIKEYYKSKSFSGLVEISRKILTKNISHINIILSMSFLKLRRDIKIQMRFYEDSGSIV